MFSKNFLAIVKILLYVSGCLEYSFWYLDIRSIFFDCLSTYLDILSGFKDSLSAYQVSFFGIQEYPSCCPEALADC